MKSIIKKILKRHVSVSHNEQIQPSNLQIDKKVFSNIAELCAKEMNNSMDNIDNISTVPDMSNVDNEYLQNAICQILKEYDMQTKHNTETFKKHGCDVFHCNSQRPQLPLRGIQRV